MPSFLVQWNPAKCLGPYREFENGHCVAWRFAAHKASKIGDEVFMRRSGSERLGIVQGRITGFTKPMQTRWGSRVSPMVQFVVDKIADEDGDPLASDDDLFAIDDSQQWRSQSSGVSINPDAAARLRDHIRLSPNERAYRIFEPKPRSASFMSFSIVRAFRPPNSASEWAGRENRPGTCISASCARSASICSGQPRTASVLVDGMVPSSSNGRARRPMAEPDSAFDPRR
jgi:hypothetical protein